MCGDLSSLVSLNLCVFPLRTFHCFVTMHAVVLIFIDIPLHVDPPPPMVMQQCLVLVHITQLLLMPLSHSF